MPKILNRSPKPDPEQMYQCVSSYVSKLGAFREGQELRGTHPGVRENFKFWAPVGIDDDELGAARNAVEYANPGGDGREAPENRRTLEPIPSDRRYRVTQAIVGDRTFLGPGQLVDSADPTIATLMKRNPGHFVPDPQ